MTPTLLWWRGARSSHWWSCWVVRAAAHHLQQHIDQMYTHIHININSVDPPGGGLSNPPHQAKTRSPDIIYTQYTDRHIHTHHNTQCTRHTAHARRIYVHSYTETHTKQTETHHTSLHTTPPHLHTSLQTYTLILPVVFWTIYRLF